MTTVSVIMNIFRRGPNFADQISAIRSQTHKVSEILVWENGADKSGFELSQDQSVWGARASRNLGVWARFSFALNSKSDFVWVIDDDSIPGPMWLESVLDEFAKAPGVYGSRGLRFFGTSSYSLYEEFGPNKNNSKTEQVDIVGHNWVFPRSWLQYFWAEYGNAYSSDLAGEDIHLSFAVQKHLGLGTFVPPHPPSNQDVWGEVPKLAKLDGASSEAISRQPKSLKRFEDAYSHYISLGFEPMLGQSEKNLLARLAYEAQSAGLRRAPNLVHKIARALRISKGGG